MIIRPIQNRNLRIFNKVTIKKMGFYAALTSLGTVITLYPQKAKAELGPPDPNEVDFLEL